MLYRNYQILVISLFVLKLANIGKMFALNIICIMVLAGIVVFKKKKFN